MTYERREGDDDEDNDRDEPNGGRLSNQDFIRFDGGNNLRVVLTEERRCENGEDQQRPPSYRGHRQIHRREGGRADVRGQLNVVIRKTFMDLLAKRGVAGVQGRDLPQYFRLKTVRIVLVANDSVRCTR